MRQIPENMTALSKPSHHRSMAAVHSRARRRSESSQQIAIIWQYRFPAKSGGTTPAWTGSIASSSSESAFGDRA